MEPLQDFFKTTFKNLQGRVFVGFNKAKKEGALFWEKNPLMDTMKHFFREGDFWNKSVHFMKEMYTGFVLKIDRWYTRRSELVPFVKNSFERVKKYSIDTYSKLVERGEYTRRDLITLFVIALFLGIAIKSVATHFVTIGFEDYTLAPKESLYDMNALQQKVVSQGSVSPKDDVVEGRACSELDN